MSAWLESAQARAEQIDDWLSPERAQSLELLRQQKWPTRKTEAWKYTSLKPLERIGLTPAESAVEIESIAELDSIDLVFVDGKFNAEVSACEFPAGLEIVRLGEADSAAQTWAREVFAKIKPNRHLFGLINDVLAADGVLIRVAEGAQIERPIRLLQISTEGVESHTRALVKLEAGAKAAVVEQYVGSAASFNTGVAEYFIGSGASLEHYRFALQTDAALSVGGSHFKLAEKAELNSTLVGFGSKLARVDVDIDHAEPHALAKFNAIYLLDGSEVFDLHATVEHTVANGTTEENIRGIVADHAKATFNGRIHIHRDAQKTLAELNNRNLLMANTAEINTKPELEIYADDVRCAHGATVAEIDKKAMYYLQSRGVSKADAQVMLNFGFINELVDQMSNEQLAEWLRPQLRARFAGMKLST